MRGRVLSFDVRSGEGMISGEDGRRYTFIRADLKGGATTIYTGAVVDFQLADERAVEIYVLAPPNDKERIVAALLAFFLGVWGVHKFYLGRTTAGVIMLLCGTLGWLLIIPGLAVSLIALIEFIIYLVKSDDQFHRDYVVGDRSWF
jgi:TM2 domain-containing membrane protein YozV